MNDSLKKRNVWCAFTKPTSIRTPIAECNRNLCKPDAAKRRPAGAKKPNKPHRLYFKSSNHKKKFLRSIEKMEGMSFDKSSDEDDSEVAEQSLMQLYADSSSKSSDDNENHSDLHVLVLEPGNMLKEADVIMTEVDAPCTQVEKSLAPPQNDQSSVGSAVSHLSVDTHASLRSH